MSKPQPSLDPKTLKELVLHSLETLKAQAIVVIDVRGRANFTDYMIVASGTSDRHLKALADQLHIDAKAAGNPPLSTEGEDSSNWIVVDLGDVVIHLMRPDVRATYELEKLWRIGNLNRNEHHHPA